MKKLSALILVLVLLFTFSISAFAVKSPSGKEFYDVYINYTGSGKSSDVVEHNAVEKGETVTLTPSESDLDFIGWNFYDSDMKTAKEGTDYEIVSIKLEDGSAAVEGTHYTLKNGKILAKNGTILVVEIEPGTTPLYVSDVYKDVDIEFNLPDDGGTLSPSTGDSVNPAIVALLSFAILVSGAVATLTAKKAFAKN